MGTVHRLFSLRRGFTLLALVFFLLAALPAIGLAAPAQSSEAAPLAHGTWYTVQPGDTLSKIAWRYGTTVSALMTANGLTDANHIYSGQKLKIPTESGSCGRYHTVAYGETLSGIALWYGVSAHRLASANDITNYNHIYSGQSLCIPGGGVGPAPVPSGGFWYTVTYNDTLSAIAWRYGTTAWAIMSANNLTSANRILVGQKLWIPSGYAPPAYPQPTPTPMPPATAVKITGGPWTALYYNNKELGGSPVVTRLESKIHFDWGVGSPDSSVNSDGFSALWTSINTFEATTYRFTSKADDGVRLYVDGILVIDDWNVHPATEKNGEIALSAGSHTVQVRFFEEAGTASIEVYWAKK